MGFGLFSFFSSVFIFSTFLLQICSSQKLWEALQNDPQASQFVAIVNKAELSGDLLGPEPTTVFVPSNAAMTALGSSIPDQVAFVKRHINKFFTSDRLVTPIAVTTSNKGSVFSQLTNCVDIGFGNPFYQSDGLYWSVAKSPPGNLINQALIITPDKLVDNHVYHIISSALWPAPTSGTLKNYFDSASSNPSIAQFVKMWSTASIRYPIFNRLTSSAEFTLFVPIDSAWQSFSDNLMNNLLNDPTKNYTALNQLLDAHILPYQIVFPEWANGTNTPIKFSPGLSPANSATLQNDGNDYYVMNGNTRAKILSTHNVLVSRGILHYIDRPLISLIQSKDDFLQKYANRFYSTCQADTICQNLLRNSQGTIIAVSDNGMQNWAQMKSDLVISTTAMGLYFLSGQVSLTNINSGSSLSTSQGGSVRVRRVEGTFFIDGMVKPGDFMPAKVLMSDFSGSDGNIILVDDVICCTPPSSRTIQSYLMQQSGNVSTSPSLVVTTTIATTIQGNGSQPNTTSGNSGGSNNNVPQQNFGNGSYSLFLSEWSMIQSFFDLKVVPGYMTLFVPSNAAIQKFRSAGIQYTDITKRRKILQRHLIPTNLNLFQMQLSTKTIYEVATANYRDLREFVKLAIRDNTTAILTVRSINVQVNLNEGSILTSNGYVYPVEEMLYDQND